jgi:HEAT repeat protein
MVRVPRSLLCVFGIGVLCGAGGNQDAAIGADTAWARIFSAEKHWAQETAVSTKTIGVLIAYAMSQSGESGAEALKHLATKAKTEVKIPSIWALRYISVDSAVVVALKRALRSPNVHLASVAADTICHSRAKHESLQPLWLESLRSNHAEVRRLALSNAAAMKPVLSGKQSLVLALCADPSPDVRAAAIRALHVENARTGMWMETVLDRLDDESLLVRSAAADLLGDHATDTPRVGRAIFRQLLATKIGTEGVSALGRFKSIADETIPTLREFAGGQHRAFSRREFRVPVEYRLLAARSLARLGYSDDQTVLLLARWAVEGVRWGVSPPLVYSLDPSEGKTALRECPDVTERLRSLLDTESYTNIRFAATGLTEIGADLERFVPRLLQIIRTPLPGAEFAIDALRKAGIATEQVRQDLRRAFVQGPPSVQFRAAQSLWNWPEERESVLQRLHAATQGDELPGLYVRAIAQLDPLGIRGTEVLLEILNQGTWNRDVARALRSQSTAGEIAVPALLRLLEDTTNRATAARSLGRYTEHSATIGPRLAELLADPRARVAAAESLASLNYHKGGVVPALSKALLDRDFEWARTARETLAELGEDVERFYLDRLPARRAVLGLGLLGDEAQSSVSSLEMLVTESSGPELFWALGRVGGVKSRARLQILIRALVRVSID